MTNGFVFTFKENNQNNNYSLSSAPKIIDYTKNVDAADRISSSIKKTLLMYGENLMTIKGLSNEMASSICNEIENKVNIITENIDACCNLLDGVINSARVQADDILESSQRAYNNYMRSARSNDNTVDRI